MEGKFGVRYLLIGVLVPVNQSRESGDSQDDQAVTMLEVYDRRFGRDFHRDAELVLHHVNGGLMAGVQARGDAAFDNFPCLLDSKLALGDGAGRGEHARRNAETEISSSFGNVYICLYHIIVKRNVK